MRLIELTKKDYNTPLEDLLEKWGVIREDKKVCCPMECFINSNTEEKLKDGMLKLFKKRYPFLRDNKVASSNAFYCLNYMPTTKEEIPDDCVLIDDEAAKEYLDNWKREF